MFRLSKSLKSMLLMLFMPLLVTACSGFMATPPCELSDQYILKDSSFHILWEKPDMYLPNCDSGPLIQGISSHVFVMTMPKAGSSMITALDSQTGTVLWQQPESPCIEILASDRNLYVGDYNTIRQYDPETGQLTDKIKLPLDAGSIGPMYFAEDKIFALTPRSGRSLIYDIATKEIELSRPSLPYTPFVVENGVLYLQDAEGIKAEDANTQKVLWKYSINPGMNPLFDGNAVIVPTLSDNIYILNKATGGLIAKVYAHAISNVVQDTTRIYFLTQDGALEIIDKSSGQIVQKISLSPVPFLLAEPDKIVGKYNIWVDSQNKIVIASFGTSCQLMAFKLTSQ